MKSKYLKLAASLAGVGYSLYYFSTLSIDSWHFIDNVDLVIHEAGHFIFLIFGDFMHVFGGSLMQLLMPALFAFYFIKNGQKYSGAFMFYWLAINFFNVALYASDAVNMNLPLLGGDSVMHDWNYLLSSTGLIWATSTVANVIYTLGMLAVFAGVCFSCAAFLESVED